MLALAEGRYAEALSDFEAAGAKPWQIVARAKLARENATPIAATDPCEAAFFGGQYSRAIEVCAPDALARAAAVAELKRGR